MAFTKSSFKVFGMAIKNISFTSLFLKDNLLLTIPTLIKIRCLLELSTA